jgi:hypothetical protein
MKPAPRYEWDSPEARAAQVFGESAAAGWVLGGAAGFATVVVAGTIHADADPFVVVWYGLFFAAPFASGIGLVVGMLAGGAAHALVRHGERRLGAQRVARLFPAVGLLITLPLAALIGSVGGAGWCAAVVSIVAVLTLTGALVIARRYLRRIGAPAVH